MTIITKEQYDAIADRFLGESCRNIETDGTYEYETIIDHDGQDVAFASWHKGEVSYHQVDQS